MSEGTGDALDAGTETQEITADEVVDVARSASDQRVLNDNVKRAKAKVAQAEAHLAGAQEALAIAEAELEGV